MIDLIIASVVIINSFTAGGSPAVGGAGKILQEDATFLLQQDGSSKIQKEFAGTGNFFQEDGTSFLMQQDGTSKVKQE